MKFIALFLALVSLAQARNPLTQAIIDSIHNLDGLNVNAPLQIRVDQLGYRPTDPMKTAWVSNPPTKTFNVLRLPDSASVLQGSIDSVGIFSEKGVVAKQQIGASASATAYSLQDTTVKSSSLWRIDLSKLQTPGKYVVRIGTANSAPFTIGDNIYNQSLEKLSLFFGTQRCGLEPSWLHGSCHIHDGESLGASFDGVAEGGWHDCGDHVKAPFTIGYATLALAMTHATHPEADADVHGARHGDAPDGIPDLLREAKVGADYIFNLYKASRASGKFAQRDLVHSVGDLTDHAFWGLPEIQESQTPARGGRPRVVASGVGADVAGSFAASLALFAHSWKAYSPTYADSLLTAATLIYDSIVMPKRGTTSPTDFYSASRTRDDEAMATLALWVATENPRFGFDLISNTAINSNSSAQYNDGEFPAGHLGVSGGFTSGGWTTDYGNTEAWVLYGLAKLILPNGATAAKYGISTTVRDSLREDAIQALRTSIANGSNGTDAITYPGIHVDQPYLGLFTSVDWGFNRYNMGMVTELAMLYDLTQDANAHKVMLQNLHYLHGANPWGISFQVGVGTRNLQHLHNRAANPELSNLSGVPLAPRPLLGAICGGQKPGASLSDLASDYVSTESCIDFAAQALLPFVVLAKAGETSAPTALPRNNESHTLQVTAFILPTSKTSPNAHSYLMLQNSGSYTVKSGSEIRVWMREVSGAVLTPKGFDNSLFGPDGMASILKFTLGSFVENGALSYIPITLTDSLVPGATARIELQPNTGNWTGIPWSSLAGSWSLQGINTAGTLPMGPDAVQTIGGKPTLVWQVAPYITVEDGGLRIWGQAPSDPVSMRKLFGRSPQWKPAQIFDLKGRLIQVP
jgi:hypothetical protein